MKIIINIPEDVNVNVEGNLIKVSKEQINLVREFPSRSVSIKKQDKTIEIENLLPNSKSRALVGTFKAHINNMLSGVNKPFIYKLKVCSLHFPMSIKMSGNILEVQNFLGGKKPKKVKISSDVNVAIEGEIITVNSPNKELAGITASNIEQLTRIRNKDRRVFQDGIYMIEKAGKKIE